MTYERAFFRPERPMFSRPGLMLVVLVHLGLGYAFITGLSVTRIFNPVPPPVIVENVPVPVDKETPPPPLTDDVRIDRKAPQIDDAPTRVPPADFPRYPTDSGPTLNPGPVDGPGGGIEIAPPKAPDLPPMPVHVAAQPKAGNVISDDDYPASSRRANQSGRVGTRFRVSTDGRVRGCEVVISSGFPRLDEATCSIIEHRFRFVPARDDGRVVEEQRTQTVVWALRE